MESCFKKIYLVTCPTYNTLNYLKDLNIVECSKLKILYDPIIKVREINKKKKKKYFTKTISCQLVGLLNKKILCFSVKLLKK